MIRALRHPRWVGGLVVAVVFAVTCVLLAQWQLDRRVQRAERNAAVLENYDAAPVALATALDRLGGVDGEPGPREQWTPVTLLGRYDPEGTVLVRNRPQDDTNGYWVVVPFDTGTATSTPVRLLVVRGWVPAGTSADAPSAVPAPPQGTVELVARLRSGESPATRTAPTGQTYRLDPPRLLGDGSDGSSRATTPLTGAYGVLALEDGEPPVGLATLERPDTDPGPHLAYGVQWYLFALAGLAIWGVLAHRHGVEEGAEAARGHGAGTDWVYDPGR